MNPVYTSDDGLWAVIPVTDYMKLPQGTPRSKTRDDPQDALHKAVWEQQLTTPPGPKSQAGYVKVRVSDLPKAGVRPQVVLAPANYANPVRGKQPKFIPEYPQKCLVCGGGVLVLFTSTEHEGGVCPGPKKRLKS